MPSLMEQAQILRAHLQRKSSPRTLHDIASEINTHYVEALMKKPGHTPAWVTYTKPYQEAMRALDTIDERYGAESAYSIVLYFLTNTISWRGPDAKRIKAELNALLKSCPEGKRL